MQLNKAVIFTHIPIPMDEYHNYGAKEASKLINRIKPYIKAHLKCKNIGLVYYYVDTGIRLTLQHLKEKSKTLQFSIEELEFEQNTRNCLKLAVDYAVKELIEESSIPFKRMDAPGFLFIGLPHLLTLIHSLFKINPELIKDLAGPDSRFTYDSPKFIEAVIRLVRGAHAAHNNFPVFRIDEDVEVNEKSIKLLIENAVKAEFDPIRTYSFFSGGYGVKKKFDPVNDYAVRIHWLIDRESQELNKKAETFIRDIGEIGATQTHEYDNSEFMKKFINSNYNGISANRKSQQVISGAGLYMSRKAIATLPPFMKFGTLVTWIDDHLKRRLHETLGHLTEEDLEHINDAIFKQDRHPNGITDKDINWARDVYFERLFCGCIMHSLITTPDSDKGELSILIEEILTKGKTSANSKEIKEKLHKKANETANIILNIWKSADYNNKSIKKWALKMESNMSNCIDKLVKDAFAYIQLVADWNKYVSAIEQLTPIHAYWLFKSVEDVN